MSDRLALLPPGYPRYGLAVDKAAARLFEVPVPLADLWNPWKCPAAHLPFLAWTLSVDVWDSDWPETKKRSVIAHSLELHRLKGTLGGIRRHVALLDAEVVGAIVPPAKCFPSRRRSREERDAALSVLPQLRLYDYVERATAVGAFLGDFSGRFFTDEGGAKLFFPLPSTALSRMQPRAVLFDMGIETPLVRGKSVLSGTGAIETIYFPGVRPNAIFSGEPLGLRRYPMRSTAADRVYALNVIEASPSTRLLHRFAVLASADPVDSYPDHVAVRGFNRMGIFAGQPVHGYLAPSTARRRLYSVIYLRADRRLPAQRRSISFLGDDRLGIPAYTAELKITIPGKRPNWIADDFLKGFIAATPKKALRQTIDAVAISKSARDKVLIDTRTARPLAIGEALFVGSDLIVGTLTRS